MISTAVDVGVHQPLGEHRVRISPSPGVAWESTTHKFWAFLEEFLQRQKGEGRALEAMGTECAECR